MEYLFFKVCLQWFFSKKDNKPDRSKLEQTEKKCKTLRNLLSFLGVLLQKEVHFDLTGTCSEASGKLKLCMNSDTCYRYLDESILREYSLH